MDPTFLLTPNDFNKIAIEPEIKEPYLLCYLLGSMSYGRRVAEKVAKKLGLKIVIIPSSPSDMLFFHKKINGVGPREFLGLIKNASFICTDSFHGLALSLNYNKSFLAFTRRNPDGVFSNASRLKSISELLGVSDRLLTVGDNIDYNCLEIDYEKVNTFLLRQRELSMEYLRNALE